MQQDLASTGVVLAPQSNSPAVEAHGADHPAAHSSPTDAHAVAHGAGTENSKFAIWLFLSSEVLLFAVMIAAVLLVRWAYPHEHDILNVPLTSLSTFILLASSYMVVRALSGIQSGDKKKFLRSFFLIIVFGLIFLGFQIFEFTTLSHEGLTLSSGPFGFAFFTLTGFHGFHVIIGVVWGLVVFNNGFNGKYSKESHFGVEFFGLYWHFVDVVWIFIFTVVYLI